jgi:hypothetical protein
MSLFASQGGSVSQEAVEEVARAVNAHQFISAFPKGYDTEVHLTSPHLIHFTSHFTSPHFTSSLTSLYLTSPHRSIMAH